MMNWISRIGFALLCAVDIQAEAAILRVCQSGCTYNSVQTAVQAANDGDIVELEAGQVFVEGVTPPAKRGVTIRSSRWSELPPLTERIDPVVHAPLLATIKMPNAFAPALAFGQEENVVLENGVDISADTMHFETRSGFGNNQPVSCYGTNLPVPLTRGEKYYLRNFNEETRTGQLSVTVDGPIIDLLNMGSAGSTNYYARPRCTAWNTPEDWTVRGIRLEIPANPTTQVFWLVRVGSNQQPTLRMGPNRIRFEQVVVTGEESGLLGPVTCLALVAGRGHEVISSWVGKCQGTDALESKAIWLQNVEDVEIRNNYVSSATINILTAGGDAASRQNVKNIRIRGNFVEKPGYMMYKSGAGEPTGECYYGGGSGAFYRRTDVTPNTCANGACYKCQTDSTWALDTNAQYLPGHLNTKNLMEFKDCDGCLVEGNVLRGSYVGPDAGQGPCILISTGTGSGFGSGYHINHNITIRNNWCDQVYRPITIASGTESGAPPFEQLPLRNIAVTNNLFTNIARFPALSQWPTPGDVVVRNLYVTLGTAGFRFSKNTFRPAMGSTSNNGMMIGPGAWPSDPFLRDLEIQDNIFQFQGQPPRCAFCITSPPADLFNCSDQGVLRFLPNTTDKQVKNNLFSGGVYNRDYDFVRESGCTARMFGNNEFAATVENVGYVSSTNHRLASDSPYSAANGNAVMLASDGSDVGTDVDVLEMHTLPALAGKAPMPEQLGLSVEAGTTQAVLRFQRPSETACTVRVYSAAARIPANLIGDTNSVERQADNRAGNIVEAGAVQFLLGGEAALSPGQRYQYHVDCGGLWAIGWLETLAGSAGGESDLVVEAGSSGETGVVEYSNSSDFASPQSLTAVSVSGGKIEMKMPAASAARYVRYRIVTGQGQTRKRSGVRIQPAR